MSDIVIRVENLGKRYVLKHQHRLNGHKTLRETITNQTRSLKQALFNVHSKKAIPSTHEEFWALKDVSFEVKRGDRLGIIGRNGAGKSTLLKILSRIVEPTRGKARIKGRVASLLEVGTGFHNELTGRENVYLNGAILGMSRSEITRKFDEIVSFAEVEKFLDTPVKHYSSGMYVRLAFAVAAHLEPEILIVDEVLAVGDVQFQKKCLGKMQDVAESEERTILFVSHNMDAMQRLCSHSLMFEHGKLIDYGATSRLVARYMSANVDQATPGEWIDVSQMSRTGTGGAKFVAVKYLSPDGAMGTQPYSTGAIDFFLNIYSDEARTISSLAVVLFDRRGTKLVNADTIVLGETITLQKATNIVQLRIEHLYLNPDSYVVGLWLCNRETSTVFDYIQSAFEIDVINLRSEGLGMKPDFDGAVTCPFRILQPAQYSFD